MTDEDELLRRCQQGDAAALEALVARLKDRVFRLAWRMTGDAALAEEATANALAKTWLKCRQWRGESSARTWIFRLAVRATLDAQRSQRRWRRRRGSALPENAANHCAAPSDANAAGERRAENAARLERAMAQLAERDRALLHLYYFEERDLAEIAAILETNRDAVKMRLHRARERLKPLLGEMGDER